MDTPFGEARRLGYFLLICRLLLLTGPTDRDAFSESIVKRAEKMKPLLRQYKRTTGILRSIPVCRNYVEFAAWMDFIKIDGRMIVPNGYTIFLAKLSAQDSFNLSNREKIAVFLHLLSKSREFSRVLGILESVIVPSDLFKHDLNEHLAETILEWLVDLEIIGPRTKQRGFFLVNEIGKSLKRPLLRSNLNMVCAEYSSRILRQRVVPTVKVPRKMLWESVQYSIRKLSPQTRSEIDPSLHSALPLLLETQLRLAEAHGKFLSLSDIIDQTSIVSTYYGAMFRWNAMSQSGYIKVGTL